MKKPLTMSCSVFSIFALLMFLIKIDLADAASPIAGLSGIPQAAPGSLGGAPLAGGISPAIPAPIGVAAAVRGTVEIKTAGQAAKTIKSGMPIFLGDEISTGPKSHLQLLLRDETTFTLGPDSRITVDEFVYDSKTDAGKVGAFVAKGVFRFVTGKVARKNPRQMTVKLPAGVIGIRGTIVAGRGPRVVLLGPGKDNNTGDTPGSISVGTNGGEVGISRAGFGTIVEDPNKPPSAPAEVPKAEMDSITNELQPPANEPIQNQAPEGGGEKSPTEHANQDTFGVAGDASDTKNTGELEEALGSDQAQSAQDSVSSASKVNDGITTLEQLRTIESGQFSFTQSNVTLKNGSSNVGSYTIKFDIDFGARTVGSGHSSVSGSASNIDSVNSFQFNLGTQSFASGSGDATYTYSGLSDALGLTGSSASVTVTAKNSGGVIAANGDHSVTVTKGANTASGSGNAPRTSGLST